MPQTLAQLVRAKYPGAYDDLSDQALETQVRAKFPGVYDDLPSSGAPPAPKGQTVEGSTFGEKVKNAAVMIGDVAVGVGKGAVHTAIDVAHTAARSHMLPGLDPGSLPDELVDRAREKTAYTNVPQMVGGALETAAELALPVTKAAEAVPTVARAGVKFQAVSAAAKTIPVDVNAPGQVALRIHQLSERGASMPLVVRKFLNRVTDPDKGEMLYDEARDFASNISRLSANEYQRLTPVVAREVANLRVTMNQAVADAARKAGKYQEYAAAMRQYAQAMRIRSAYNAVLEGAKHTVPYLSATGAGFYLAHKLKDLFSDE